METVQDPSVVLASRATDAGRLAWLARLGDIIQSFVRLAFGCWHRHISRPFTLWGHTYEVCLDCGKELPYSLEHMSRIDEIKDSHVSQASLYTGSIEPTSD